MITSDDIIVVTNSAEKYGHLMLYGCIVPRPQQIHTLCSHLYTQKYCGYIILRHLNDVLNHESEPLSRYSTYKACR